MTSCTRWWSWIGATLAGLALALMAMLIGQDGHGGVDVGSSAPAGAQGPRPAVAMAVLGDSDSHGYQDTLRIPADGRARGGEYRTRTFQWTEALARLRGVQLDLGPRGEWGTRITWARLREALGWTARAPRKLDHRHNFALSGARCDALTTGYHRQAPRLADLVDRAPGRWRQGIVVVRIGVNSFGMRDSLDRLARDPEDAVVQATIRDCLGRIRESIDLLRARQPDLRFVLVGILNNADWPKYLELWRTPQAIRNIEAGLDRFDATLKSWCAVDPALAFFDDRSWFAARWGRRGPGGEPAYRAVTVGGLLRVEHAIGDPPQHSVLADGHAGAVWNGLWAQSLVELLNVRFGTDIEPIRDREILDLLGFDRRPPEKS